MNQQANVEDLSRDLIVGFLDEIKSDLAKPARKMSLETLGRQLGVVAGPKEAPLPINVGLLFFTEHPERFFPATQIDVVWFPEGAGGDRFEEKIFKGPLARMTREALDYIRRNYLSETVIKHRDRAEATRVQSYPFEAVEEALVNAVYHRSYEEREPIEVRISPDDLVVVSYPGPDRSIHLTELRRGKAVARRYRNRRIGEILKELELTEGRSTGIPKILRAMKANGSPPPTFDFDQDHSYFITRLRIHPAVPKATALVEEDLVTPPATPPATPPVTPPVGRLLRLLAAKGEIGNAQIREELGLKDRRHLRKVYVEPALAAELIEHTIPEKPSSPLQQYRLTDRGQAWLAAELETREAS